MKQQAKLSTFQNCFLAAMMVFSLASCGEKSEKTAAASQVAAKVNGSEISVHQINAVLSKSQGITAENVAQAKLEILNKLVDQQLALDQAIEKKVDRSPEVMMAIEFAKREIIARAYFDQLVAALPKPTPEEVGKYYVENPSLFSKRRIYNIQEMTVEARPEILDLIKQMVATGKSMDEIGNLLKSKGINYRVGSATKPAEQIPLEVLPRISALTDGQSIVIEIPQNYLVMRIASSQAVPVDEETARPRIQLFLAHQRAKKAVEDEIKRMKDSAKIEFMGEFSGKTVK